MIKPKRPPDIAYLAQQNWVPNCVVLDVDELYAMKRVVRDPGKQTLIAVRVIQITRDAILKAIGPASGRVIR